MLYLGSRNGVLCEIELVVRLKKERAPDEEHQEPEGHATCIRFLACPSVNRVRQTTSGWGIRGRSARLQQTPTAGHRPPKRKERQKYLEIARAQF